MDPAKRIGANEIVIVNWEKEKTQPTKKDLDKLNTIFAF